MAVSHGHSRSAFNNQATCFLAATQAPGAFLLTPPTRVYRLTQIFCVSAIDAEERLRRIVDQANVDFVREDVALINEAYERIEKLRGFHPLGAIDEHLAVHLHARQAELFQKRNFTSVQFDFATHGKSFPLVLPDVEQLMSPP